MTREEVVKILTLTIFLLLVGCGDQLNLDGPKKYFAKNKIGGSTDYAVMTNGIDHVITVHGYWDDLAVCEIIIEALKKDAPQASFHCIPLND